MKNFKKLNIKKIFRSFKTGVLSTNIFFFLIAVFFSTLALAAALTVTHIDNRIPAGANSGQCFSSKKSDEAAGNFDFIDLYHDRTEDVADVLWSDDGTMVFTINDNMNKTTGAKGFMGDLDLSMNKVRDPFELKTVKTFPVDDISHTCDDIDGFDVNHADFQAQGMAAEADQYRAIHIAPVSYTHLTLPTNREV